MHLLDTLAELKIRLDRGNSLITWLRNLLIIMAALKIILQPTISEMIPLFIFVVALVYLLGSLDMDMLGFFQIENKLLASKYNPVLNKIDKKFK